MVWNKTLRLFHRKVLCLRRLPIEPLRCRNYGFQWYWDLLRSIGFDGYNGLQKSLWHVIFSITVLPRRFTDVGELFTSLGLFPFMQRDIIQGEMSPDDIRTSGMYDVGNSTTMPFNYGGLLVFNTKTLTIQTGVDLQGKTICIRVSWNNGPWSSWNNFTFNQQSV